jgi:hypothetical protein
MRIIDPADAGMDNPPAPEVEVLDRRLILAWKTIGELQQRVEELEASLERRWADITHLDTKLADVLDRAEEGQCAEWPRCACGRGGPDLCAVPETGDQP